MPDNAKAFAWFYVLKSNIPMPQLTNV